MAKGNYQLVILASIGAALAGGFAGYYFKSEDKAPSLNVSLGIENDGNADTDFINKFTMSQHYMNRRTLLDSLKVDADSIIFLGDEIIEQAEWKDTWPAEKILNRGIDLDTVAGVKDRLPELLESKPKQMILSIGRQDILQNSDYFQRDFEAILSMIQEQSPKTKLIVMDLIPLSQDYANSDKLNPVINQFNEKLSQFQADYDFVLVSLASKLTDASGYLKEDYSADGWQLNGAGYQIIVEALKPVVEEGA